jgi:SnoaL-like domain
MVGCRIAATVPESSIEQLLQAVDALDVDAVIALMEPDVRLLTVEGHSATGATGVRAMLSDFLTSLRSSTHRITAQWHQDNVWIAEVDASYELSDMTRIGVLPRAFVVRDGPGGLSDVRVYGAHERPLSEVGGHEREMRLGGHWIPPL